MEKGSFLSADNKTDVVYYFFENKKIKPKAVLQISHGMQDYILRYNELISFLNSKGIVVCGNDDLGHGLTSKSSSTDGYFADKNGYKYVVKDLLTMTKIAKDRYKNVPYFLLGHSMGSFYARLYAYLYEGELSGLIIEGTSGRVFGTRFGIFLADLISKVTNPKNTCKTIENTMLKSYYKYIDNVETGKEWVTSDNKKLEEYINDDRCNFSFKVSAYRDMLTVLKFVNSNKCIKDTPKDLPIFICSGDKDPVGNYGKGVREVYNRFVKEKQEDVELKLYAGARHELHNEVPLIRKEFCEDVYSWILKRI